MNWEQLHFIRPTWLWALAPLLPVMFVLWRANRSSAAWQRVCDAHLLKHLLVDDQGKSRRLPLAMLGLAWVGAVAALSGPAWERLPQPSFKEARPTVVAFELAPSMNATDVAPSRIERARFKLIDAFGQRQGGQMGLVIYAEEPYVVTPITDDPRVIEEMAKVLSTDLMPGQGCRADRAIEESLALLEQSGDTKGRILLIADGVGDAPQETVAAAARAAQAGHAVSVLAIAADGAVDEELRAVADAGKGGFARLSASDSDLALTLPDSGPLSVGALEESHMRTDSWRDMGGWLALIPLLFAPFAFRRTRKGALVALAALSTGASAQAQSVGDWFSRPDQRAATAFADERYEEASVEFVDPAWRAAALYKDGAYEQAAELYRRSEVSDRGYNLGNSLARIGAYEEALSAYDELLKQHPEHADGRFNRDLIQKLLDEQQQEEQEQEQEDDSQSEDCCDGEESQDDSQREEGSEDGAQQEDPQQGQEGEEQDGEQQAGQEQTAEPGEGQPESGAPEEESQGDSQEQESASSAQQAPGEQSELEDSDAGAQADELAEEMQQEGVSQEPTHAEPTEEEGEEDGERYAVDDQSPPRAYDEKEQATRQLLSRIPDDPGALLREKLRRRYLRQRYAPTRSNSRGW